VVQAPAQEKTSRPKSRGKATPGADQMEKAEVDHFEELSQQIAEEGGHFILILLGDNLWQQALAFTEALRCSYIPVTKPIIVFTRSAPSPDIVNDLFKSYELVSFSLGNSRRPSDLYRAGVDKAKTVVMLSCANGGDPRMVDGAGVITLCSIESDLRANGLHVPMILELQREDSIKLMPLQGSLKDADLSSAVTVDTSDRSLGAQTQFNLQPRFTSGNIFNANCLGSLLADAFYTPGIIELFEALTFGEAVGQTSFPWQIEVPAAYVGRTYAELTEMLSGPLDKCIPIGIYRASLVLCCPKLSEMLLAGDRIFVLGTAAFGSRCKNDGSLVETSLRAAGSRDSESEGLVSPTLSSPPPTSDQLMK